MNINLNITASADVLAAINNLATAFTRFDTTPAAEPKKKVNRKVETVVPETGTVEADLSGNANTAVEEKEVEVIEAAKPEVTEEVISLEDIRAVAAEKTQDGKRLEVKALLTKYGAEKLPALDKAKYADFFTELKAL